MTLKLGSVFHSLNSRELFKIFLNVFFCFLGRIHDHPCLNGGIYLSFAHNTYQCICPEAYIGKNCQGNLYLTIFKSKISNGKRERMLCT